MSNPSLPEEYWTERVSIDVLPEPWRTVADQLRPFFIDVPTVEVLRKGNRIIEIRDAIGQTEYTITSRRRHGVVRGALDA